MNIKPPETIINEPIILICPFCQGEWEFHLKEVFEQAEIVFTCQKCQKKFTVTKI